MANRLSSITLCIAWLWRKFFVFSKGGRELSGVCAETEGTSLCDGWSEVSWCLVDCVMKTLSRARIEEHFLTLINVPQWNKNLPQCAVFPWSPLFWSLNWMLLTAIYNQWRRICGFVSVRVYPLIQWSNLQSMKHEDSINGICCTSIIKPQTNGNLSSLFVSLFACHSLEHKTNVNVLNFSLIIFSHKTKNWKMRWLRPVKRVEIIRLIINSGENWTVFRNLFVRPCVIDTNNINNQLDATIMVY